MTHYGLKLCFCERFMPFVDVFGCEGARLPLPLIAGKKLYCSGSNSLTFEQGIM